MIIIYILLRIARKKTDPADRRKLMELAKAFVEVAFNNFD